MRNPKISICIPTFNRADLLKKTLQSVLHQTQKPYEVLIVDNYSKDSTAEIAQKYEKYGFRYIRNKKNIGMIGNINKCISEATGEYLTILPSDDLISPEWYKVWSRIIKTQKAKIYTSSVAVIDENSRLFYIDHAFERSKMIKQDSSMIEFSNHCSVIPPTAATIFKKDIFVEIGLFESKFGTEADVKFSLKMFQKYDIYYAKEILFAHRLHAAQSFDRKFEIKNTQSRLDKLENQFKIIKTFFKYNPHKEERVYIVNTFCLILATTNLYLLKLQFKKVFGTYSLIRKYFPDAFTKFRDWSDFIRAQLLYIKKAAFGRFPIGRDRSGVIWLKQYI